MIVIRWFFSSTVRRAVAMWRHVQKLLEAQRDILSPPAIAAMNDAIAALQQTVAQGGDRPALKKQIANLEEAANKWLKPYPHAVWRENVEVLLVALAVAMGIRTFFLQPFKIPTGSMQPTLYGVTSNPDFKAVRGFSDDLHPNPDFSIPGRFERFFRYWLTGVSYRQVVAQADGHLTFAEPDPKRFLLFNLWQRFQIGPVWYKVWFPPDDLLERAGLTKDHNRVLTPKLFKAGEDILKIRFVSGDHLFVNRVVYNFRHPKRGEIVVFKTAGVNHPMVPPDQYYIKRLVALGGERVQIGADHHLIINDRRLDASTPHFENVYNFRDDAKENEYFGHVRLGMFAEPDQEYLVQTNGYMVMGDNTRNSLDSRFFGSFGREYVIGKSSFVYWPISDRFGFGYQ
jgi:signal peptidase I